MPESDYLEALSPPIDYTDQAECDIFFGIFMCLPPTLQVEIYRLHEKEELKLWANNGVIHVPKLTQAAMHFNEKLWEIHYRQQAGLDRLDDY